MCLALDHTFMSFKQNQMFDVLCTKSHNYVTKVTGKPVCVVKCFCNVFSFGIMSNSHRLDEVIPGVQCTQYGMSGICLYPYP